MKNSNERPGSYSTSHSKKKTSAIYTKITLVLEIIKYLHLFSRINGEIVQFSIVLGSNKV